MRHCLSKLSRSGPFVQVLHQQIRGGGGSNTSLISLMQGGWGVQNVEKPADVILERSLILIDTHIDMVYDMLYHLTYVIKCYAVI